MPNDREYDKISKYVIKIVETLDEANNVVKEHEESNKQKFVVYVQSKDFGDSGLSERSHKILWEDDAIEYCGVPFMVLGSKVFDCQYGKDRNISAKMKRLSAGSSSPYKNPNQIRMTKKLGCTAKLTIKEIAMFQDFKITTNTKWKRETASKRLRTVIKEGKMTFYHEYQKYFAVVIPKLEFHSNHPLDPEIQLTDLNLLQPEKKKSEKQNVSKIPINLAPKCREIIDDIKAFTHLIEEEGSLIKDLYRNLEMIKSYVVAYIQQRELQKTNQVDFQTQVDIISDSDENINTSANANSTENTNSIVIPPRKRKGKELAGPFKEQKLTENNKGDEDVTEEEIDSCVIGDSTFPEILPRCHVERYTPSVTSSINMLTTPIYEIVSLKDQTSDNSTAVDDSNSNVTTDDKQPQVSQMNQQNNFDVLTSMVKALQEANK